MQDQELLVKPENQEVFVALLRACMAELKYHSEDKDVWYFRRKLEELLPEVQLDDEVMQKLSKLLNSCKQSAIALKEESPQKFVFYPRQDELPKIPGPEHFKVIEYRDSLGRYHNIDGKPAIQWWDYSNGAYMAAFYYTHGVLDRVDGPAVDHGENHTQSQYWVKGVQITKEELQHLNSIEPETNHEKIAQYQDTTIKVATLLFLIPGILILVSTLAAISASPVLSAVTASIAILSCLMATYILKHHTAGSSK